jgi:vesicle transport through interaction with t-SNAREs protein 1
MEARSFSTEQSRPYLQKIKEYRADLKKLKEDLKKAASGAGGGSSGSRAELGLADDYYKTSAGQRERLLSATERLGKTSDRIQQGRQQLLETEVSIKIKLLDVVFFFQKGLFCFYFILLFVFSSGRPPVLQF